MGRIGPSYPQRAAGCCDAAQAGGQMLRCSGILGQIFSELISFCGQLIAVCMLTMAIVGPMINHGSNQATSQLRKRHHGQEHPPRTDRNHRSTDQGPHKRARCTAYPSGSRGICHLVSHNPDERTVTLMVEREPPNSLAEVRQAKHGQEIHRRLRS